MTLHPRTIATLEKLDNVDWFDRVGQRDTNTSTVLSSWDEAIQHCSTTQWENLLLEAANRLRERIVERSKERFAQWNDIAVDVRSVIVPFVKRKIEPVVQYNHLPKVFEDTVQWDVAHICMEAEYADIFPPAFYASQAYWYVNGHFPCGWQGRFPEGTLIIY